MAGRIFINYRREDSRADARSIYQRLERAFGSHKLFMDVDTIQKGRDFTKVLDDHLAQSDIMLAIIGKRWLGAEDEKGERRLEDPKDFVRVEIARALERDIPVIPVLVDGARMPKGSELPDDLEALSRRQASIVTHENFALDLEGLVRDLTGLQPRRRRRTWMAATAAAVAVAVGLVALISIYALRGTNGSEEVALDTADGLSIETGEQSSMGASVAPVVSPDTAAQAADEAEAQAKAEEARKQREAAAIAAAIAKYEEERKQREAAEEAVRAKLEQERRLREAAEQAATQAKLEQERMLREAAERAAAQAKLEQERMQREAAEEAVAQAKLQQERLQQEAAEKAQAQASAAAQQRNQQVAVATEDDDIPRVIVAPGDAQRFTIKMGSTAELTKSAILVAVSQPDLERNSIGIKINGRGTRMGVGQEFALDVHGGGSCKLGLQQVRADRASFRLRC
jgi:chemotaxis protein histidine kinase CheA